MAAPVIVAENISKRFGDVVALQPLSLEIAANRVVGLLGGNGAGKTTTMAMLLGLLKPTSGRIEIFGLDLERHRYALSPRMNFSSPYVDLPHRLTVRENLRVYARLYGLKRPDERIATLAKDLEIEAFLRRPVGKLSAGQRTRVALAKSLINRPALLLLDEPTASLDPDTADWVRSYLERYRVEARATIVLASHNMAEVERLCDEVIMLKAGRLVDRDSPHRLIERYGRSTLEEVFLDIARDRARAAQ